ncbi:unnamed protein product [Blepharisma stoltei]|uniref:Uncharacterized protein n=1 Tax=Blepharisma stoltei TaxID=1481888 RepID=A0AAU9KC34_9CILI|nr:unnamed protein product [Blepharisma stoltei]
MHPNFDRKINNLEVILTRERPNVFEKNVFWKKIIKRCTMSRSTACNLIGVFQYWGISSLLPPWANKTIGKIPKKPPWDNKKFFMKKKLIYKWYRYLPVFELYHLSVEFFPCVKRGFHMWNQKGLHMWNSLFAHGKNSTLRW